MYDGDNVIEELNASGTPTARYAMGLGIDEPLADRMLSFPRKRESMPAYWTGASNSLDSRPTPSRGQALRGNDIEADGLGSTTSLTNSTGAISNKYFYDSFGNVYSSSGSIVNPYQFTAREFDSETGLYYYRARYYDPSVGRFLSEDPLRWRSGTPDFYPYAFNNPVLLVDPFGLRCSCDYSISTGHFQCYRQGQGGSSYFIDTYGYSGFGYAMNNQAETSVPGRVAEGRVTQGGPIPMGTWMFGEGYHGHAGNPQFDLTATQNVSIPPGRSGATGSFMVHGDLLAGPPGSASAGCVILPLSDRTKLEQCHGGSLQVIP